MFPPSEGIEVDGESQGDEEASDDRGVKGDFLSDYAIGITSEVGSFQQIERNQKSARKKDADVKATSL